MAYKIVDSKGVFIGVENTKQEAIQRADMATSIMSLLAWCDVEYNGDSWTLRKDDGVLEIVMIKRMRVLDYPRWYWMLLKG